MKKMRAVWMAAAIGLLISGCGQQQKLEGWKADENSIYVNRAMAVESAMVYTSQKDNDTYSQEEMQKFAEEAVIDYNTANGAEAASANTEGGTPLPVAVKSVKLAGKTGTMIFGYAGPDDFVKFSQEVEDTSHTVSSLSVKKVSDAAAAGELADMTLVTADGKAVEVSEVEKKADAVIVTVEGAAAVYTEGSVLYRSEQAAAKGTNGVQTAEGKNIIVFQ